MDLSLARRHIETLSYNGFSDKSKFDMNIWFLENKLSYFINIVSWSKYRQPFQPIVA